MLAHGTGALNIDGCRVATDEDTRRPFGTPSDHVGQLRNLPHGELNIGSPIGRWPANVVLDEDAAAELDRQSGVSRDGVAVKRNRVGGGYQAPSAFGIYANEAASDITYDGQGGASRFYYTAKAAPDERPRVNGISHPTVKPLDLIRWLVRLVTPPGGLVLDPFAGSGTTGEACIIEGFRCVLIEREADYLPLIEARLNKPIQPVLGVAP